MIPLPELITKVAIDADFMLYNVGFTSEDSTEREALNRLAEWVTDIVYMNLDCEDFKAYLTPKRNFRYDIAKTVPYKSNRKGAEKPKHFDALRKHMQGMGAITIEGIEADDAVAIESTINLNKIWIVHVDKDLDQLEGWHYNPNKDHKYYITAFEGYYNFYTQMLTGDRVDAIPGLKGIGPVKAIHFLYNCKTKEELHSAVLKAYTGMGHGMEYFTEQGQLLWLQRYEGDIWQPA